MATKVNINSFKRIVFHMFFFSLLAAAATDMHARPTVNLSAPEHAYIQDISIQVLTRAYDKLGYDLKIHKLPNVRSLISANKGEFDGEVSRIANLNSKYPNLRALPTPVNVINVIALGQKDSKTIHALKDIQKDTLCVRGIKLVEKLVEENHIDCSFVVNVKQAITMLDLGRAEYLLLPEINARVSLLDHSFKNIRIASPILSSENLYHYMHVKNSSLIGPLNKILTQMKIKGEIRDIRSSYFKNKIAQ